MCYQTPFWPLIPDEYSTVEGQEKFQDIKGLSEVVNRRRADRSIDSIKGQKHNGTVKTLLSI